MPSTFRIFKVAPETRERYFSNVRGDNIYAPEFRAHAARVMAGFDMTLSMLDDVEVFDAQIAHLNKQHIDLDVDAKYFDVSGYMYCDKYSFHDSHYCFSLSHWIVRHKKVRQKS